MSDQTRRRRGRPGRDPEPGERVGLSLRVTPEMKRALDDAAQAAGRSLSQQAEYHLEQVFSRRPLLSVMEAAYGRELGGLLMTIGDAMRSVADYKLQANAGASPQWVYDQMMLAAQHVLAALRPEGKAEMAELFTVYGKSSPAVAAVRSKVAEIAEFERQLGVKMADWRLRKLADKSVEDSARDLMGETLASRAEVS